MLLVTGITGHTGKYFLEQLIEKKYEGKIRCFVRKSTNTRQLENVPLNIEIFRGDIADSNSIELAMKDVKEIVHIYNIHNSLDILKAALRNNVEKVILVHTTGIYSKFKEASAGYKKIEQDIQILLADNKDLNVLILRPSMIYGDLCDHNMSKFIKMVDKLKFIPVIDGGKSLIQPVNARDLGKSYYQVLTMLDGKKAYDLTGDRPIKMKEALNIIAVNLDKKIYFINVPLGLGVFVAKFIKLLSLNKVDLVEKVQRMAEDRSYSHETARKAFNYKPMSFEDGIAIEVKQYIENKRK